MAAFSHLSTPLATDFVSFYAAGRQALAGAASQVYAHMAHHAAEEAATAPGMPYVYFYYPPIYLIWCELLALPPEPAAFFLFQAASLSAWLLTMRSILRVEGWSWLLPPPPPPILAFPAVFFTLLTGQKAFVITALLAALTILVDKRPVLAGVMLGSMCFGLHLVLLVPVALAAGGYWRTFVSASVTVIAWVAISIALFGGDIWRDYVNLLASSGAVYEGGLVDLNTYVTSYGAVRVSRRRSCPGACRPSRRHAAGKSSPSGWIWRRKPELAIRSAALAAGMLLSAPIALMYDLLLLTVSIAWLVRLGRRTGFLPWEKLTLFFCFFVPLVSRYLSQGLHIPLGAWLLAAVPRAGVLAEDPPRIAAGRRQ